MSQLLDVPLTQVSNSCWYRYVILRNGEQSPTRAQARVRVYEQFGPETTRWTAASVLETKRLFDEIAYPHGAYPNESFFAALWGYIKLEMLKVRTKLNHFALKMKLYLRANQVAFDALRQLVPISLAA